MTEFNLDALLDSAAEQAASSGLFKQDTPAPKGKHIMRVAWAKGGDRTSKGDKVALRIKGVVAAGEPHAGASAWGGMFWDPSDEDSFGRALGQIIAAGVKVSDVKEALAGLGSAEESAEALAELLVDCYFSTTVRYEVYQGEQRPKLGFLNRVPAGWTPTTSTTPRPPVGPPRVTAPLPPTAPTRTSGNLPF